MHFEMKPFRLRLIFVFLIIVVSFVWFYKYTTLNIDDVATVRDLNAFDNMEIIINGGNDFGQKNSQKRVIEQTCNIPKLDINGSAVAGFFHTTPPLNCHMGTDANWLFINDDGNFELISERKKADCQIVYFKRANNSENSEGYPVKVKEGGKMEQDFGKVSCSDNWLSWSGLLMSVVPKRETMQRIKKVSRAKDASGLDVFFMGFDSLSQMTFRRKLPKTVNFLETVLGSVVLNGYNIVGDGTPQAYIPILTSQTELELPLTRKRDNSSKYVDDAYPFIWKNFSDEGYVTSYGEDAFNIGTFTYRLKGFRKSPADHFTSPFFKEVEKNNNRNCLGSEPLHKSWFRYIREFMRGYSSLPRFLLMHQSLLSHDDINLVGVEDDDLAAFLEKMHKEGYFDNALVILMSDHGHRFSQLRDTHQGQLEERLPFFSIALPPKFKQTSHGVKAFENLKKNKDRLTTPFDIHSTLMDILHWPSEDQLTVVQDTKKRSLSLFRPIPEARTCDQAGVEPHWCTCLNWQDAMSDSSSIELAKAAVWSMNKQMKDVRHLCARLSLKELIDAKKLVPNEGLLKYKQVKDEDGFVADLSGRTQAAFASYQLKLSTTPGRAIYEVTLFYDILKGAVHVDLNSISHTSKFGDDPHCIIDQNYFLATFCVCHDRV